ncbi:hypothetical protein ACH4FX_05150 [Streptomyces sp. NPDC018019]|uniref:hypothetical protein n=1 Tax=Streptomyces sp. NPDC018019 TaxID=3365030 RepID=UPI0037AECF5F
MSVPDENRPKSEKTDDTAAARAERDRRSRQQRGAGRTMQEALREADVRPQDYEEKK